jgi:undecaprenyl-diphosphatase
MDGTRFLTGRAWALCLAGASVCFMACVTPTPALGDVDEANVPTLVAADESAAPAEAQQKITIPQAALLGVVEGVTEYLPVSSTGHLILAGHAMGLTRFSGETGFFGRKLEKAGAIDAFEIVIQLGAILAVLGLYRRRVGQMCRGLAGKSPQGLKLVGLLVLAFLPAAVVGKLFHEKIEDHLFGPIPVILAMAAGGVLMIVVEHFFWSRRKNARHTSQVDMVTWGQALAIGLAQCLAMWPGTSRSMITILAGLVVGLDMVTAAEFSFLLALPTLGAATLYSGYKHWHELMSAAGPAGLAVGLIISGIVAAIAVKAFVQWLTRHGMMPFGVYRIIMAVVLYGYFLNH